eukprot:m.88984 g.88984  ORF g.88984 m.88984 type:complete len:53 (+) comp11691_c0_seq3:59-217(+)
MSQNEVGIVMGCLVLMTLVVSATCLVIWRRRVVSGERTRQSLCCHLDHTFLE